MKTTWQIAFGIVLLMGIVAGATYITQYSKPVQIVAPVTKREKDAGPQTPTIPPLKYHTRVAIWRPEIEVPLSTEEDRAKFVRSVELGVVSDYIFWAHNPTDAPVKLGMKDASCTCAGVDYGLIAAADWRMFAQRQAVASTVDSLAGGIFGCATIDPAAIVGLMQTINWKNLQVPDTAMPSVPPAGPDGLPVLIRVHVKPKALSKDENGDSLRVTMHGRTATGVFENPELMLKYMVVPPIGFVPHQVVVKDFGHDEKRSQDIFIWSVTRDSFKPKFTVTGLDALAKDDPCVEIGEPTALSPREIAFFVQQLVASEAKFKGLSPTCMYRVTITVHERRGDHQLDLGPIMRKIYLSVDGGSEPLMIPLQGLVRGEVRVNGGDEYDRIAMGSFNLKQGVSRTISLVANRADVDIDIAGKNGSRLDAELSKPEMVNGQKQWQLTVTVPPDSAAGELLPGTAVVLTTKDKIPRKLRIPVTGIAAR